MQDNLTSGIDAAQSGVTLLICTSNGAQRLPETLRYVAAQQVPAGIAWEVVLVSNASTDDTLAVALRLWADLGAPAPLRLFDEPRPGKENALICGFDEARYECIGIVDDDNWLYPDYVAQATRLLHLHPEIGVLGACAEGKFEAEPPSWFAQFQAVFAIGPQAPKSGPIRKHDAYVYGAGSVVRRSGWRHLRAQGFVFTTSAKRGLTLSGAEDVELGDALRLAGYDLWYDERLRLRHYMYKERLTVDYLQRMGQGTGGSGLTSLVYFFLHREPDLELATFRRRYLRWLAWQSRDIVVRPGELLTYARHGLDPTFPTTFETMRRIVRLRMGLTHHSQAEDIFRQVKDLQRRLQANPAPIAAPAS